ncbi:hypothetical protein [Streptomyces sp. N35]|uniref:hypothetical protein n=1 Tax=Streptomyces sp. N35 TaxID=2795730 RepID=UPI001F326E2F|nr:hypothetical protein [Streptomyces sp. N35]
MRGCADELPDPLPPPRGAAGPEGRGGAATRTPQKPTPVRKKPASRQASPAAARATSSTSTTANPAGPEPDFEALARVADARDRAADIIDSAREQASVLQTEAETAAARTLADTHAQAAAVLTEAQNRAAGITADADQDATAHRAAAKKDLEAARGDAERLLANARERTETMVAEARAQVVDLTELAATDREATSKAVAELRRLAEADLAEIAAHVERRRAEAGKILTRAQEQADELVAAAQREAEQARARYTELAETAAAQYEGRRAEAEQLYANAVQAADARRREAETHAAAARAEAEQTRTELSEQLRKLTDQFDADAAAKRTALAAELAELRQACDTQREQLRDEGKTIAAKLRAAAQKDADRITAEAERKAKAITERAQADEARAHRLIEEAREAKRANSRWRGWHQNLSRKAWKTAPWIALAAGVGLAASGEYELARMVGINEYVAPLLPVSIDVYCVTAFRTKKDIAAALLLMASANVVFHLSEQAHLVPEGAAAPWPLTTFVVLIFVAVIWRVHSLMHDAGTDGHGGTDTAAGTDGRTSTAAARTDGSVGTQHARTSPTGTDLYGRHAGTGHGRTAGDAVRTEPVHGMPHDAGAAGANAGLTSAYSSRTGDVQAAKNGGSRTGTEHTGRTSAAAYERTACTSTATARTNPPDHDLAGRISTPGNRSRSGSTTATAPRTGTATRPRTDDELLPLVQTLPRDVDGYVTISRVRTTLSVNQDRAIRLLKLAGRLSPEDADKYLK